MTYELYKEKKEKWFTVLCFYEGLGTELFYV